MNDNIRSINYDMPFYISTKAKDLIKGMLQLRPKKRLTAVEVRSKLKFVA